MGLTPLVYLYLLEVIGFFIIASLAITQSRSRVNIAFMIFAVAAGMWQLLQVSSIVAVSWGYPHVATYLLMTSVLLSAVMATSVLIFALAYSRDKWRLGLLIPAVFIGALAYFSPELASVSITHQAVGIPKLDQYYGMVLAYCTLLFLIALTIFVRSYRTALSRQYKMQTKIILAGLSITGTIIILASFYTSDFSDSSIAQLLLPTASLMMLFIFFYAIRKTGLFDIRLAAVRSVAYGLSLISLSLLYYFLAYLVSVVLFRGDIVSGLSLSPINILLALILAFAFQPMRRFFDRATDSIFFRDRYRTEDFFERLNEVLTSTTDLRTLLQRSASEIASTLKAEDAFFYVQYGESRHVSAGIKKHKIFPPQDIEVLNKYVSVNGGDIVVTDLLTEDGVRRLLRSHKVAVLMPLMRRKLVLGYLALGDRRAGDYTDRDIRVLETVDDELLIAIQNSLSVQEVRDINTNLEQRIEAATAELRTSNARLKRLDAAKDEFLSMASHQLRTPLTSVKGYLSMMLEGDMGRVTPMQKQVLEEAFSSSERMVHLIHDFLNVSRLQTGKFMLELGNVNLAALVADEVKSLQRVAKSHNITLEFVNKAGDLSLRLDDTKIRQVVMNYIDNAIYYSHPNTTVTVSLEKTTTEAVLKVKDTGIGVPKSEQSELFEKFYRASNARRQRPDGTGVGIYLAKRVIEALGGAIIFESKEGKGSTFGFKLPLETTPSTVTTPAE